MAITKLQSGYKLPKPLVCAICAVNLTLDQATAGSFDHSRRQVFACVSHFSEVEKLINGWADFFAAEQRKHVEIEFRSFGIIPVEGDSNAWTDT